MQNFERYTREIPDKSKPILERVEQKFGFVPNLLKGMAASPNALETYMQIDEIYETTSLSPEERQIVLLTASRLNECEYCTSIHSMLAEKTALEWETVEKIRNRESLPNARYEALRKFAERVVKNNGTLPRDEWTEFREAGYTERNALDVTVGVALKTLTNTVNHLMDTPLDSQFKSREWTRDRVKATNPSA